MVSHVVIVAFALSTFDMPAPLRDDYSSGRYQEMVEHADSLLAQSVGLTLPELARLHLWKGFGQAAMGDRLSARASFGVALSLDPSIELDPREVSPKIISEFEAARASRLDADEEPVGPTYVVVGDSRPRAALRSMILPGWGQWSDGRRTKGAIFAAAACAAVGGWFAASSWEDDAHDRYLAATDTEISSAYDEYNQAYKTHRALGYGVIAVWAGAVADVLLGPSTPVRVIGSGTTLGVSLGQTLR